MGSFHVLYFSKYKAVFQLSYTYKHKAGIDLPVQSHASYEASALPPRHQGWIT